MNDRERKQWWADFIAVAGGAIWMGILYLALTEYALWRLGG